jgi:two-component system, LytTR family, sensor kinase
MILRNQQTGITKWSIIIICWAAVAFFYTTQALIQNPYRDSPLVWWRIGIWESYFCLIWFAFTPLVLRLSKTFPLAYGHILRNLSIYVFASIALSLIHLVLFTAGIPILPAYRVFEMRPAFEFFRIYRSLVAGYLHFCLISFWGIILVSYLVKFYRDYRERALRASQLEASLAQSQLQILKNQLQPHFLFNTMNSISVLMQEDPTAANRMLVRLSEFLRVTLKSEATQLVPLREELEILRDYLEIERTRFQDRLTVDFDVEEKLLDAQVPNLILQPLVENAIRHGIAPRSGPGSIQIRATQDDDHLILIVADDGVGLRNKSNQPNGIGFRNTRERLKRLYDDDQTFDVVSCEKGGLRIRIRIPFKGNE